MGDIGQSAHFVDSGQYAGVDFFYVHSAACNASGELLTSIQAAAGSGGGTNLPDIWIAFFRTCDGRGINVSVKVSSRTARVTKE